MSVRPELTSRIEGDDSSAGPVLLFFATAVAWLLIGSVFGLVVAFKFSFPDWLGDAPALTFGRLRPAHLNTVIYGWASLALCGVFVWLASRLCRTAIRWKNLLYISAVIWNLGVLWGTIELLRGNSAGQEWLEFPTWSWVMITVAAVLFSLSIIKTFRARDVDHIYISLWYMLAAVIWFPLLWVLAHLPIYTGVTQAASNWWYAHNALTVWFTPAGLAAAYYFIPKVIGRPIHSYYLSLIGFWTFALFYNWNGIHHLVGGPLPTWLISVSIVASVLMFIPVIAVAINHHMTMVGHFGKLKSSPTLRFVVFGAISYTAVSMQGSIEAIRAQSEITHFTHYTIGHAHLGLYAFVTMIMFGSIYYIMPRIVKWEWPYPRLIKVHFWLVASGVILYFAAMTVGGVFQGLYMNDAAKPFIDSVEVTRPYLMARSIGGSMMLLGQIVFIYLFSLMLFRKGAFRAMPPWGSKIAEASHPDAPGAEVAS
ncbi:MAG TPA: cbb3-type cytochrome c oxidase subunit I [Thermodesulfobacteriota bacterium]|nr:cbb3-type cytochrome c oxidase subunit I [Thermodesulfobacteriota bacterium]